MSAHTLTHKHTGMPVKTPPAAPKGGGGMMGMMGIFVYV